MPGVTLTRLVLAVALACGTNAALAASDAKPVFDPEVARRITPEQVEHRREKGEKTIFVDTRGNTGEAVIRGAQHVPNDRIETWAKDVPKDALIVTYCT